jgi:hypothetical protein
VRPRILEELYDTFRKFNMFEVLHFQRHEQQRKIPKDNKALRPTKYNRGRENTIRFGNRTKQIHNIDSDGCAPPPPTKKSGRKIVGLHNQKIETELSAPEKSIIAREEVIQAGDEVEGEVKIDLYTTCFMKEIQTT